MKMARTNKSPETKELKKLGTKTKIINYGTKEGWNVTGRGNVVMIGSAKCTFDSGGKLLMIE